MHRSLSPSAAIAAFAALTVGLTCACSSSSGTHAAAPASAGSTATGAPRAQSDSATGHLGALRIIGGYIPQPASPDVAAAYFTVVNGGSTADTLQRVTTDVTATVMPMDESERGGTGSMTDLAKVVIPAHGSFRFTPGHAHLMLEKPTRTLRQGDRVRMTVTFAKAGTLTLTLPVVPLTGPTGAMTSP